MSEQAKTTVLADNSVCALNGEANGVQICKWKTNLETTTTATARDLIQTSSCVQRRTSKYAKMNAAGPAQSPKQGFSLAGLIRQGMSGSCSHLLMLLCE